MTVGALYLWEHVNLKLRPKLLRELDPGDRIVSHDFRMGKWEPDTTIHAGKGQGRKSDHPRLDRSRRGPSRLMDISDELPPEELSSKP